MKNLKYIYSEVRCDFYDDLYHCWCIDAWRTSNDNEEGKVVAKVDGTTGNVTYLEDDARYDFQVQERITILQDEIKENNETLN